MKVTGLVVSTVGVVALVGAGLAGWQTWELRVQTQHLRAQVLAADRRADDAVAQAAQLRAQVEAVEVEPEGFAAGYNMNTVVGLLDDVASTVRDLEDRVAELEDGASQPAAMPDIEFRVSDLGAQVDELDSQLYWLCMAVQRELGTPRVC